ncbi:hypothetical protein V6N12_017090 [Hibiscus sabdariffa]|uniref:Uncharacterized protein n=1 Tax=Hibiscus sabdariffa TaxID=183260 RepID=A0ABR2AD45_9ROSI
MEPRQRYVVPHRSVKTLTFEIRRPTLRSPGNHPVREGIGAGLGVVVVVRGSASMVNGVCCFGEGGVLAAVEVALGLLDGGSVYGVFNEWRWVDGWVMIGLGSMGLGVVYGVLLCSGMMASAMVRGGEDSRCGLVRVELGDERLLDDD